MSKKTHCDLCPEPAAVWGTVGAYCEPCSAAFVKRVRRSMVVDPATTRRLINGSRVAR
jgi:hypothetical protein